VMMDQTITLAVNQDASLLIKSDGLAEIPTKLLSVLSVEMDFTSKQKTVMMATSLTEMAVPHYAK